MREGDGGVDEDDGVVGVDRRHDGSPGGALAPPGERGREPPPSSSCLDFPLYGRRVPPLVLGRHGSRRVGATPRLDLSLFSSLFRDSVFWPNTISSIAWRSVTLIGLKF